MALFGILPPPTPGSLKQVFKRVSVNPTPNPKGYNYLGKTNPNPIPFLAKIGYLLKIEG